MNIISFIKTILDYQSNAVHKLAYAISPLIAEVVNEILLLKGRVVLSGIGKSSYIAKKIASSFSSTGTASFYIHPAEAAHGDLGMITEKDIVMLLSNSGETAELFCIVNYCKRFNIKVILITKNINSSLAINSNYVINIPNIPEASSIDAPTTSSLLMLALVDAIMIAIHELRGFTKEHFKIFHPGGNIGKNLIKVSELMQSIDALPITSNDTTVFDAVKIMTKGGLGCVVVVNNEFEKKILGILTDGDLRRNINNDFSSLLVRDIATKDPIVITSNIFAGEALLLMNKYCINVLLVIDDELRLIGILHLHDLLRAGIN